LILVLARCHINSVLRVQPLMPVLLIFRLAHGSERNILRAHLPSHLLTRVGCTLGEAVLRC
jgi:hypothetical protein